MPADASRAVTLAATLRGGWGINNLSLEYVKGKDQSFASIFPPLDVGF